MDQGPKLRLTTLLFLLLTFPLCADEIDHTTHQAQRATIKELIAKLQSPNKDPNPTFDPRTAFPKDYDFSEQDKVEKARKELLGLGKEAFPHLIEHLRDREYSRSISTAIRCRSLYVGDVCFMLIEDQVDLAGMCYKGRRGADGKDHAYRGYFSQYCGCGWYTQQGIRKWWKEHESRSLKEMQIDALEWSIERERTIGFPGEKDREDYLLPLLEKLADVRKK